MTATKLSRRPFLPILACVLPLLAAACAAPEPDEAIAGSGSDLSSPTANGKISAAGVSISVNNSLLETASIPGHNQNSHVDVCHVYENGTEAQKHACDNYPTNFHPMQCTESVNPATDTRPAQYGSVCQSGNGFPDLSYRPYDQGNGTYTVYFVNHNDPTDRKSASIAYTTFIFNVALEGRDFDPSVGFYADEPIANFSIESGSTRKVKGLHLSVSVDSELAGEVMGCATGYSTAGMSADEIAQKDAEQLALCQSPNAKIEGREGWTEMTLSNYSRPLTILSSDATPLLQPNLHIIFTFEVRGMLYTYIFTT